MTLDIATLLRNYSVVLTLLNDKDTNQMTHYTPTGAWAARMIRNTVALAAWTAVWVATLALARFGPGGLWNDAALTVLAIVFSVLAGVGMLLANKRHLSGLDEMQRTIQLQAMAWALGAGLVGGCAWTLSDRHDLIAFDATIAHLVMFMAVVYLAGCIAGLRRYR
jgi:predicted membrane protein